MEKFLVSSRKYRPQTFESVVGQQHITNTLKNAIKTNKLAQAFLFCGPRGVGKTTCARILAKVMNMPDPAHALDDGSYGVFDQETALNIFELDAASNNSVDDIRSLVEQVRFAPQVGAYKIYIIDEVHMLSTAAFNAFLKTLEEPPSYAIFILATTEKHKILPTILSRCQVFEFNRIKTQDIAQHLTEICAKENVSYEPDALFTIAQKADGGLRDALSMFDQMVSFSNSNLTYASVADNLSIIDFDTFYNITHTLHTENLPDVLLQFNSVVQRGFEPLNFLVSIAEHFRNLLLASRPKTAVLLEVSDNIRQKCTTQATETGIEWLLGALNICSQFEVNHRNVKNIRFHIELALMKICYLRAAYQLTHLPAAEGTSTEKKNLIPNINATQSVGQVADAPAIYQPTAPKNTAGSGSFLGLGARPAAIATHLQATDVVGSAPQSVASAQEVSQADFAAFWQQYTENIKGSKPSIAAAFVRQMPTISQNYIEVEAVNTVEKSLLEDYRTTLANDLRKAFGAAIGIRFTVNEQMQAITKTLTPNEIYKAMVAENPQLADLRQAVELTIDW